MSSEKKRWFQINSTFRSVCSDRLVEKASIKIIAKQGWQEKCLLLCGNTIVYIGVLLRTYDPALWKGHRGNTLEVAP